MTLFRAVKAGMAAAVFVFLAASAAQAREASFLDPGGGFAGATDEAVKVEPKNEIDTGETVVNTARRTTLFFSNQSGGPIIIQKMALNVDANVTAELTNDDCSKQGSIASGNRCSVEVSVTPTAPGPWTVEVLMTHNGAGRIARAKLTGKTGGAVEKKDTGLMMSTKEISPVNFGDVDVGNKAVRSALMVNDSPEPITLYSIDVIEADNGLQRLDQGCTVDMELKPGESCPVTLLWQPTSGGAISTDLIIRHSGRTGFAVVSVRGNAKGGEPKEAAKIDAGAKPGGTPLPPSADDLEKAAKIAAVPASALKEAPAPGGPLRLIGTVGSRALLLLPNGSTKVAAAGDTLDLGDKSGKVLSVDAKSVEIMIDDKKKELTLEAAPELTARAQEAAAAESKDKDKDKSKSGGSSSYSRSVPSATTLPVGNTAGSTPPPARGGGG